MEATLEADRLTGDAGLDAEHAVQLQLLDAVIDAVGIGTPVSDLEPLLRQLADYTKVHFHSEQLLMRRYAYPGLPAHVTEHDRLIQELNAIVEASRFGYVTPDRLLLTALREWLVSHVRGMDRSLGAFLAEVNRQQP